MCTTQLTAIPIPSIPYKILWSIANRLLGYMISRQHLSKLCLLDVLIKKLTRTLSCLALNVQVSFSQKPAAIRLLKVGRFRSK